jgi:thiosulfate/3-mercaptopyruvate sulfurtransferase
MEPMQHRAIALRAGLVVTLAILLAAATVPAGPAGGGYANPELLVETGELARRLGAPGLRLVDLRGDPDRGEAAYRAGHIRGAAYLTTRELDDPAANAEGLPIRPERAAELFGRLGIDHDTTVVAYDDAGGVLAARLFFVLEYFGHTRTRVLNGGLAKWQREGRPLTTEIPRIAPARFAPRPRRELVATAAEVKGSLGKEEVCLLDARSPAEFAGRDVRAQRGGRIPGAVNVDWTETLNPDQTFKSAAELRALFEAAGARPDRQIVVYCQSGVRAAHDYLALRLLGYARIKTYDGSWNEWGNDPTLPLSR